MSHFTTIKTQIKDLKALRAACQELGLALVPNAQARGYNDNQIKAEQVIRLKGPYDIALNQQKDGSFGFTADFWDGRVEKEVGPNYGKLIQLYGVHKATIEARKKGHLVKRCPDRWLHQTCDRGGGRMKKTIEIIVSPTGDIVIDALGFKGADCEQATRYLEQALGVVGQKHRHQERQHQQRLRQ